MEQNVLLLPCIRLSISFSSELSLRKSRSKLLSTMRTTSPPRSSSPSIEQFFYQALVYQFAVFLLFSVRNKIVLIPDLISVQGELPRERRFIVLSGYWTQHREMSCNNAASPFTLCLGHTLRDDLDGVANGISKSGSEDFVAAPHSRVELCLPDRCSVEQRIRLTQLI